MGAILSLMDRELIDAYLAGRLDEATRAEVEARIVGDAAFRREVELTEQLRTGLRELDAQGVLDTTTARPRGAFWRRPTYALAASVVAGLSVLTALALYGQLQRGRAELVQLQQALGRLQPGAVSGSRVVSMVRTRATGSEPDLVLQGIAPHELIQLRFDVGTEPATAYRVSVDRIEDSNAVRLIELPSVATAATGEVVISVHPALMPPGDYALTLNPAGGTPAVAEVIRYRVRVSP